MWVTYNELIAVRPAGTVLYVIVIGADVASPPTVGEVVAGNGGSGNVVTAAGAQAVPVQSSTESIIDTGLASDTGFTLFFVAQDDHAPPNRQLSVGAVTFTTAPDTTRPAFGAGYPRVTQVCVPSPW